MKKLSRKQRELDVKIGLIHRHGRSKSKNRTLGNSSAFNGSDVNNWIDSHNGNGLNLTFKGNRVNIILPEKLNFFSDSITR